jgi:fumarylpyruvate hydrolase
MGQDPERDPPFFFAKPADAVFDAQPSAGASVEYPPLTNNLHHEIELAVAIGTGGRAISSAQALDHVFGYAPALDLTRRDLQKAAKAKGHPWEFGKAFDRSAPLGALVPAARIGHPTSGRVWLAVNGEVRQEGDLSELIWSVAEVISELSASIALAPGDLILTGTPAGVGTLVPGDHVSGGVEGVGDLARRVARQRA